MNLKRKLRRYASNSDHGIYRDLSILAERRPALAYAVMAPFI